MAQYQIINQRPLVALDQGNQLRRSTEITFSYGDGFTGVVLVPEDSVTPEFIRQRIEEYIARHTIPNGQ